MRNGAYFFPLRMFINGWEENDHMSSTIFFPIGCCSQKSLFICIKLRDSELCRVAGHAPSVRQRLLMAAVALVAGNRQLSIEINGIVSLCRCVSLVVWTGLDAFESLLRYFDVIHRSFCAALLQAKNLYWQEVKANRAFHSASAILEWKPLGTPLASSCRYRKYQLICLKKRTLKLKYSLNDGNNNVQSLD